MQQLLETLWTTQGVGTFEQAQHGVRAQFAAAPDIAVKTRHQEGQITARCRNTQTLADGFRQRHALRFMARMTWQIGLRCQPLAEVV